MKNARRGPTARQRRLIRSAPSVVALVITCPIYRSVIRQLARRSVGACREQARLERRLRTLKTVGTLELLDRLTFDNFIPEPTHLSPEKAHNLRLPMKPACAMPKIPMGGYC